MRNFLLACLFFGWGQALYAQDHCGQAPHQGLLDTQRPDLSEFRADLAQLILQQAQSASDQGLRAETIYIPVVFHVIHDNGPENISDDQIRDGLRILNEDFNAGNHELGDVVSAFQSIIGDAEIEFRLAVIDLNGDYTTGIDRVKSTETYTGDDGSKLNVWPRSKYLNVWVTDAITVVGANASAYAIRPAYADAVPGSDGVIINHRYLGSIGTAISNGHTLSHEVGHYLDLPHTWGETNFPECDGTSTNPNDPCFGVNNCNEDDGISDTPICLGTLGGCNTSRTTCGSLDNVQNFMDYANCDYMFTKGQVNRMRATLNLSVAQRNKLWTSSNYAATGMTELAEARFYLERRTVCRGGSLTLIDESRYDPETWLWEITGPEQHTSTEQHPTITFATAGYYNVKLTVTQGAISKTVEQEDAIYVSDVYGAGAPFKEDFDAPMAGWVVNNTGYVDDKYTWQLKSDVGYDDDQSFMVYNFGGKHRNPDELIFAAIDTRGMDQINVDFKVAYGRLNNDDKDALALMVSNDCGVSWKQLWAANSAILNDGKPLTSNAYKPSSQSEWVTFTINNAPLVWFQDLALLKFVFHAGGGNQLYVDNINVTGQFSVIPNLVYPINEATQMNSDVVLDWRCVPGADSYEYQLSKNNSFTANVASGTLSAIDDEDSELSDTRFHTSDLETGTTYFWRARATLGAVTSAWSEVWSFTVANDGVGLAERPDRKGLKLYPNPSSDRVTVELPVLDRSAQLLLCDMRGSIVYRSLLNPSDGAQAVEISLEHVPSGTYLVRVSTADMQWNERLIVH
jgi:PKD repeat protein